MWFLVCAARCCVAVCGRAAKAAQDKERTGGAQPHREGTEQGRNTGGQRCQIVTAQEPGVGSRGGQLQQSTGAPLCAAVSEVGEGEDRAREKEIDI